MTETTEETPERPARQMATETVQVPVRDLRGTRSPTLGCLGLSPTLPIAETIHERWRQMQRLAWTRDLPLWMLSKCYLDEVPAWCLRGVDACADTKFCLKQRLAEYAKRMKHND